MSTRNRIQAGDQDNRHGTSTGYDGHKCRCELCKDWRKADWADKGIFADSRGRRLVPRDRITVDPIMPTAEWVDDVAPCIVAPDMWFSGKDVPPVVLDICGTCSFKVACAKAAIASRAEHGVWAGVPLDTYGTRGRLKALRRVIDKAAS